MVDFLSGGLKQGLHRPYRCMHRTQMSQRVRISAASLHPIVGNSLRSTGPAWGGPAGTVPKARPFQTPALLAYDLVRWAGGVIDEHCWGSNLREDGCLPDSMASVSSREAMEDCAPDRVTQTAAAPAAKRALSAGVFPSNRPVANAPLNASPAAVVSTAFTWKAGMDTSNPA
jgi:hypothetical protein